MARCYLHFVMTPVYASTDMDEIFHQTQTEYIIQAWILYKMWIPNEIGNTAVKGKVQSPEI